MSIIKYFESSDSIDRACNTRGVVYCDAVIASAVRKRYSYLSRTQIKRTLEIVSVRYGENEVNANVTKLNETT